MFCQPILFPSSLFAQIIISRMNAPSITTFQKTADTGPKTFLNTIDAAGPA